MIRRFAATGLAVILLLFSFAALAEEREYIYYGTMMVVNCNEWVSLREVPGTGGRRLERVPLGALVTEAEWMPLDDRYIYCRYNGQYGYILSQYLTTEFDRPAGTMTLGLHDGLEVVAEWGGRGEGEYLDINCTDENGALRWGWRGETGFVTELSGVAAFPGGTEDAPAVMAYCTGIGLTALDFATGEILWTLPPETQNLGGSISHALAEDGRLFIGGYYGPDPVAVAPDGSVLWASDCGDNDTYWLDAVELRPEGVAAHYAVFCGSEAGGWLVYSPDTGECLGELPAAE